MPRDGSLPASRFAMPIAESIWDAKYRLKEVGGEPIDVTVEDSWRRVARALAAPEADAAAWEARFLEVLEDFRFLPAGRILAGAGSGRTVTLANCYTMGTIPDSLDGIFSALREAALTMQQGGGIGYDFSTLRPKGSLVAGVGSDASGPLSFMDVWDAMCRTIMSAGARRGAMMATMRCDHPDIEDFVEAKRDPARLRNFNLSVLVTDPFMAAVEADGDWPLVFGGRVFRTVRARDLWDRIMKATYDVAEPGVIFIDRINKLHNINYVEQIATTNPCVPAETPILTERGWIAIGDLVDTSVRIWNGEAFSEVAPYVTGRDQPLCEVRLSDGTSLVCTPTHEFILSDGSRRAATDLQPGDALEMHLFPVIESGEAADIDAYAAGLGNRDFVPVVGRAWRLADRLDWLAGLIDVDGVVHPEATENRLEIVGECDNFLHEVKLMLNTLGVGGHMSTLDDRPRLHLSAAEVRRLREIGLRTRILDLSHGGHVGDATHGVKVIDVIDLDRRADVFCFTEPQRHAGVFNGVRTGQCGEKPMGPYASCLLGSINLVKFVTTPFTETAALDMDRLRAAVRTAIRMMDNVIDVGRFPLEAQRDKAFDDRQLGLGVTGLADMLLMLRLVYGSEAAANLTRGIMREITLTAYETSVDIAAEKGSFPNFDAEKFLAEGTFAGSRLPARLKDRIRAHGIRNALLTSIAPTGTISLYAGNVSSGIEPVFAFAYTRKVLEPDGTRREEEVVDCAVQLYREQFGLGAEDPLPDWFVSAQTLSPLDHVRMQAAAQEWVDSSISKTVNCPEDISFDDFKEVYATAYALGCKGCTTYRPNPVTGSVLSVAPAPAAAPAPESADPGETPAAETAPAVAGAPAPTGPRPRDPVLEGRTWKLRWPGAAHAYYLTINDMIDEQGRRRPFEVFVNTQNTHDADLLAALTRMISAVFRRGGEVGFVAEELSQIVNPQGGHWIEGRYVPSLVALIGATIFEHMETIGFLAPRAAPAPVAAVPTAAAQARPRGAVCPSCGEATLIRASGCDSCASCGHSKCG